MDYKKWLSLEVYTPLITVKSSSVQAEDDFLFKCSQKIGLWDFLKTN